MPPLAKKEKNRKELQLHILDWIYSSMLQSYTHTAETGEELKCLGGELQEKQAAEPQPEAATNATPAVATSSVETERIQQHAPRRRRER